MQSGCFSTSVPHGQLQQPRLAFTGTKVTGSEQHERVLMSVKTRFITGHKVVVALRPSEFDMDTSFHETPDAHGGEQTDRSSARQIGRWRALLVPAGDRACERLFDSRRRHGEPGRASLVRMRLELGSRAEGKGGGAPTGMSATAAVAG